jgi:hypothetical protein
MINIYENLVVYFGQFDDLNLQKTPVTQSTLTNALTVVFTIFGAIALLIITIAGFKYTMSMGEPNATKKAKDTILYAFIGLFVSIFAVAIVNFVVRAL